MNVNDRRPTRLDVAVGEITGALADGFSRTENRLGVLHTATTTLGTTVKAVRTLLTGQGEALDKQAEALGRQESLLGRIADKLDEHLEHDKIVREQADRRARILEIEGELRDRFGAHQSLRGTVRELVAALGEERISPQLTDVRRVTLPDYWLGRAHVVLARWCAEDQDDVRIHLGMVRPADMPTVARFFALINAKAGRAPEAADWLAVYLRSHGGDPVDDELRHVMNGALRGAFGSVARDHMIAVAHEWCRRSGRPPNQVTRYTEDIGRLQRGPEEFASLVAGLDGARNRERVVAWYRPSTSLPRLHDMLAPLRADTADERPAGLVDRMIDELVNEPSRDEARLRRELADLQQKTGRSGEWSAPPAFRDTIVEFFSRVTLTPDGYGACRGLRRLALAAVAADLAPAIAEVHRLHAGTAEPGAKPDLPMTITQDSVLADLETSLADEHDRDTESQVARVTWNLTGLGWIVGGALLVGAALGAYLGGWFPVFWVFLAVAGAGALLWGAMTYRLRPARERRLRAARAGELRDARTELRRVFTGYQRVCEARDANLAQVRDLHTLIRAAATHRHEPGPAEARIPGPYPQWSIRPRESVTPPGGRRSPSR